MWMLYVIWNDLSVEVIGIRTRDCVLYWTHPCFLSVTKRPRGWLFSFHFILAKLIVYFPNRKSSWTSFILAIGCNLCHSVIYEATMAVLHDFLLSYYEGQHFYCYLCIQTVRVNKSTCYNINCLKHYGNCTWHLL